MGYTSDRSPQFRTVTIIRPHRSTTYVYAAYCYRQSIASGLSVWQSHRWALQKRLNRSRCRLGCGLGWAERITSSIVFAIALQTLLLRRCGLTSNYFDHLLILTKQERTHILANMGWNYITAHHLTFLCSHSNLNPLAKQSLEWKTYLATEPSK